MSEVDRIREYFESTEWRPTPAREYLVRERRALLRTLVTGLERLPADITICDVGCGAGSDLVGWRDAGVPESSLAGTELLAERAAIAQEALPSAEIHVVDGFELPFGSGTFDVCTASLVLSTIRAQRQRQRLLLEMARIVRPGGVVMVYDFAFKKPWNVSVVAVTTGGLADLWRRPDAVFRAAPLLPALGIALRLPAWIGGFTIRLLPRTHRVWAWHRRTT